MHFSFKWFGPALRRLTAACIVLIPLTGCNPNDIPSQREDDYLLGEAYVGSIILFANSTMAPDFFYACDGRLINSTEYSMLRAILGVTYGAEPSVGADTKFALPELEAPVSGTGYYICYSGWHPKRPSDEDPQISNDYVGAISRFGGSYNPPGTHYCDGSLIDYLGSDTRLAIALGTEFQYKDNLFRLPDLTAGINIEVNTDAAKKSYIAHYGVMPASEYYDYSGSFFCGMIKLMAGDILPLGWRVCDGAVFQVSEYTRLYDTMTYGSAPPPVKPATFTLPNIPAPIQGTRYIINTTGAWPFYQI